MLCRLWYSMQLQKVNRMTCSHVFRLVQVELETAAPFHRTYLNFSGIHLPAVA